MCVTNTAAFSNSSRINGACRDSRQATRAPIPLRQAASISRGRREALRRYRRRTESETFCGNRSIRARPIRSSRRRSASGRRSLVWVTVRPERRYRYIVYIAAAASRRAGGGDRHAPEEGSARVTAPKQTPLRRKGFGLEPTAGLEPATYCLRNNCSTN